MTKEASYQIDCACAMNLCQNFGRAPDRPDRFRQAWGVGISPDVGKSNNRFPNVIVSWLQRDQL